MRQSTSRFHRVAGILIVVTCLLSSGCAVAGAGVGAALGARADRHHPARGAFFGATIGAITGLFFDGFHHSHRHDSWCDD